MKVFVYGTLKQGHGNHHLLSKAKFIGEAEIKGWELYNLGYYPGLKEGPEDSVVKGEVYQIDGATLERLDGLEGYRNSSNDHYIRIIVDHPEHGAMYTYYYPHAVDCKYLIESGEF
jgi:gamma-glutamylcyclotransferase (GGCT)/AIG2-like uncharacterized protein YtfP